MVEERSLDLILYDRGLFFDDQDLFRLTRECDQRIDRQGPAHRDLVDREAQGAGLAVPDSEVLQGLHQVLVRLADGHNAQRGCLISDDRVIETVGFSPADRRRYPLFDQAALQLCALRRPLKSRIPVESVRGNWTIRDQVLGIGGRQFETGCTFDNLSDCLHRHPKSGVP